MKNKKIIVLLSLAMLIEEAGVKNLSICIKCKGVRYCSVDCQKTDWKLWHKNGCPAMCETKTEKILQSFGTDMQGAMFALASIVQSGGSLGSDPGDKKS